MHDALDCYETRWITDNAQPCLDSLSTSKQSRIPPPVSYDATWVFFNYPISRNLSIEPKQISYLHAPSIRDRDRNNRLCEVNELPVLSRIRIIAL
jgi:hypothetical protein